MSVKYKLSVILVIATALAISPFCRAFSACQTLGEFCGDPPSEMFPRCCPFDRDSEENQIRLKCKNIENGIGSCEPVEYEDPEEPEEEPDEGDMSSMNN